MIPPGRNRAAHQCLCQRKEEPRRQRLERRNAQLLQRARAREREREREGERDRERGGERERDSQTERRTHTHTHTHTVEDDWDGDGMNGADDVGIYSAAQIKSRPSDGRANV